MDVTGLTPLLIDAKREYVGQLTDAVAPYVVHHMHALLVAAAQQHRSQATLAFQHRLREIPHWNATSIEARFGRGFDNIFVRAAQISCGAVATTTAMVLAFLQQPYVFALTLAVVTAVLVYLYTKTTERDPVQLNKAFFKTLAAGTLAGVALTYLTTGRAERLATEPFDGPALGGI